MAHQELVTRSKSAVHPVIEGARAVHEIGLREASTPHERLQFGGCLGDELDGHSRELVSMLP